MHLARCTERKSFFELPETQAAIRAACCRVAECDYGIPPVESKVVLLAVGVGRCTKLITITIWIFCMMGLLNGPTKQLQRTVEDGKKDNA